MKAIAIEMITKYMRAKEKSCNTVSIANLT
jgi:hypothetical protein